MPKALDLNGKIFSNLKVLQKAPSKNKKSYWTCECLLCGSIKDYQTGHLTSGASKSCGCQNAKNFQNSLKQPITKQCKICGDIFQTCNRNRLYCYSCSPEQKNGSAEYQKAHKRAVKHQLILYKGGKCQMCGYNKCEGALQFHHRNPAEKEFALSAINISQNLDMASLYAEVDKCDLLCANCHSEIHYQE